MIMDTISPTGLEKKPLKRIVTLDFIRGFAILGVLGFHMLAVTYDYGARFDMGIENLPIYYIITVLILAFMGSLFPAFVIISAIGNTLSMDKKWKKLTKDNNQDSKNNAFKILLKAQLTRGIFLILIDKFIELFLNGVLTKLIIPEPTEEIIEKMLSELYHSQIIGLIGYGVILTSLVYLLAQKAGKTRKQTITPLIIVGSSFIVLAPLMNFVFTLIPGLYKYPNKTIDERGFFLNVLYVFLSPLANGWYPIFPSVSSFFLGTILGLEFSDGNFSKKLLNKIIITSIGYLIVGLTVIVAIEDDIYTKYINDLLIPTAGSLLLLVIFLYFIEIQGKGTKFAQKTIFFRGVGYLSLTIWALQWTMMIYLRIVHVIFYGTSQPFIEGPLYNTQMSGWATWGLFFGMLPFWIVLLWLWKKINFKGSLEWLFGQLMTRGKKGESSKSDLVNALYNVESVIPEEKAQKYYKPIQIAGIFFLVLLNIAGSAVALFI